MSTGRDDVMLMFAIDRAYQNYNIYIYIYIYHVFPKSRKASHGNLWVGHLPASERELP